MLFGNQTMSNAKGFTHDDANNVSVDWYTPPWVFGRLGLRFDLDPCQPSGGIPWIPADTYYDLAIDGLLAFELRGRPLLACLA
jgi:hypothetical protein